MHPMDIHRRRRRRHHSRRVRPVSDKPDRSMSFVVITVLGWVERVLQASQHISQPAAEVLAWALHRRLDLLVRPVLRRWFEEDDRRAMAFAHDPESRLAAPQSRRAQALMWLARQEEDAPRRLVSDVVRAIKERIDELSYRGKAPLERNLRKVRKQLGLDLDEERLLLMTYVASAFPNVEQFFVSGVVVGSSQVHRILSLALPCRPSSPAKALDGTFYRMGLLEEPGGCLRMAPEFWPMLEESPDALMRRGLYAEADTEAPPLADFTVPETSVRFMVSLLTCRPIGSSKHVLVYGKPGVGKTSLVRAVAREAGVRAYEIAVPDDGRARSRWAAMQACLNMTNNGEGSLIIVDDAEKLLGSERGWMVDGEVQDRSRINQLMDQDGARFVWVVNDVKHIAPSVRRRFAYCLYLPEPGRKQRQRQWEAVARKNCVTSLLGPDQAKALARQYSVPVGLMDRAARSAMSTGLKDTDPFVASVREVLDSHLALERGGTRPRRAERTCELFTTEGLNVRGDLGWTLMLAKEMDRRLRRGEEGEPRNLACLFSGPPGTGKSQLARHVGERIDREVMVRRGSDLVSMWVGKTEKNIARAFREAEDREAVLVIDEIDSMLAARGRSRRTYEVRSTNEMLTQLEKFCGIVVFTTNRQDNLDPASLRRFSVKLEFDYLDPDGNEVFYERYLTPMLENGEMTDDQRGELRALTCLTPGDFKVVRDKHSMIWIPWERTHEVMLRELSGEVRVKQRREGRRAGF